MFKKASRTVNWKDASVLTAFVGAVAIIVLAACYVVARLASEKAYREKWKDYNDCGWA